MKMENYFNNLTVDISPLQFEPSKFSFDDAKFVIIGIPFDRTSSFRSGSKFAPNAIREASYNFENYLFEHDMDFSNIPFCDIGNLEELGGSKEMLESVEEVMKILIEKNKFPVIIGGEHFMTPSVVNCYENVGVIILDAHLDFRDSYLGNKYSHACVTRRVYEIVGKKNLVILGVRSMSSEEKNDAKEMGLKYFSSFDIKEIGVEETLNKVLNFVQSNNIYLSLDVDVVDPSFAPGVGNPEPFGLTPLDIKKCINILAKKLVGFEVSEVSPYFDNGNTSALTARFIREVITVAEKKL